ncbi:hypothetical protein DUC20_24910, partial [Salmonella enterica subsp. salamae]|nr:hypothetical protein [Salmonella enterica subsp. salamae]
HCITGIRSEIYDFIGGFIHLFKQLFYVQIVLVQRAPRSVDSFRIKAATVLMLWPVKRQTTGFSLYTTLMNFQGIYSL